MDKKELNARLELHRVAVAARDMDCARAGFSMILELDCEPADNRYQPLLFGAVTSYARPFTNNKGFGALPAKWERFESEEFNNLHKEIIDYRNTVAAHSDIATNRLQILPTGVQLVVGGRSFTLDEPAYGVGTPLIGKSEIPTYIALCEYQRDRMSNATIAEMERRFMRRPGLPPVPFEFRYDQPELLIFQEHATPDMQK